MSGRPRMSAKEKKAKKALIIELLSKTPIVETACKKAGISRQMYYRWREDETNFANEADNALMASRESMNDLAESKLLGLVQESDFKAIRYWSENNNPKYMKHKNEFWRKEEVREKDSGESLNDRMERLLGLSKKRKKARLKKNQKKQG